MRGHPYCLSCSLRIHSIFRAVRLCLLGRLAPRPAPRAVRRGVMSPTASRAVGPGVMLRSRLASRSSPRSPATADGERSVLVLAALVRIMFVSSWRGIIPLPPLACLPRVPHRHGSLVSPPAPCSLSPRPSPRQSCRTSGETSPCLPLPCKAEAGGFSSSLSCGASLPAWRAVPFLSKDFPRQSFKTFLGNVLKTFPDNLLETAKHTPSYMSRPAFLRLRRSVSPPIVSPFSLSFVI